MAPTKGIASAAYLRQLERDLDDLHAQFDTAKAHLFRIAPTAKIGHEFNRARIACLELSKKILAIEKEVERVERELKRAVS